MNVLSKVTDWFRAKGAGGNGERAEGGRAGKSDLQQNMEKALKMKQEAGPQTHVPEHATAHEGMQPAQEPERPNRLPGSDPGYVPELKRSRIPRSGDAG